MKGSETMADGAALTRMKNIAYKSAVYAIPLFLIGILQVTFFAKLSILGATPDLLLGALAFLALREDHRACSVCGIISGFLYSALGTKGLPTYIIFSFLCAYVLWGVAEHTLGKNYFSYLALAFVFFTLKAVYNLAEAALSAISFNLIEAILRIAVPELISSMLFCSVPYVIMLGANKLIGKKSTKKKGSYRK